MRQPVYKTDLWCLRGHFNEDQADKYARLCDELHPKYVLEIGFCTGRSAACVLDRTRNSLERMVSVDKDLNAKSPEGRLMAALLQARFPTFKIIEQSSRDVLTPNFFRNNFPNGLGLATIDGDHSYDGCTFDLMAIAPHLINGGVIVVDDYRSGPPNGVVLSAVTDSVDDFLVQHCGEFVGEIWNSSGKGFCLIRRK